MAFEVDALPVDTHVFRVANRIGLVRPDADTPHKVERQLKRVIPREQWGEAHHLLILHGRYTCTARSPKCPKCPVSPYCKYYERLERLRRKEEALEHVRRRLAETTVRPEQVNGYLDRVGTSPVDQPLRLEQLVLRPQVDLTELIAHAGLRAEVGAEAPGMEPVERLVEIDLKYEGYVERQQEQVRKMEQMEAWHIPQDFDYHAVDNITMEAREKLSKIEPDNLGQASRISGVSPADISVLMVLLKKQGVRPGREKVAA